ncbi:uncharacterized protein LOC111048949 [Nilaparvata lugens]|uniref:uncharacterized protein LOC111048949 n=1 Tax=Nilaparvata lugens TaxID=108931 RepID=UPI00193E8AD9|nr:uncharacterized protein LOC111048949 [Nilaparvata lugens]
MSPHTFSLLILLNEHIQDRTHIREPPILTACMSFSGNMERNASTSYPSPPRPDSPPPPYSEFTPVTHRSVTPSSPLYHQFPPQYSFQPPRPLSPQDTPTSIFEPSRPSTPPSPSMMDVRCVSQAQRRALMWLKANLNLVPNYFQRLLDDSDSDEEEDPTDHRNRYIAICPVCRVADQCILLLPCMHLACKNCTTGVPPKCPCCTIRYSGWLEVNQTIHP